MAKWTKYSYGALAFCGVLSTYIGIVEYRHAMHPHEHEDIAYSHMKIRAKRPWDCPDCNCSKSVLPRLQGRGEGAGHAHC